MTRGQASTSRRFVLEAICLVAAAMLAIAFANRGRSWSPDCYALNSCDALTFAAAGGLARRGESPYSSATRTSHISRTRLEGQQPPFDIPFQYPPHSLPLFALLSLSAGRAIVLAWVATTTIGFIATAAWFLRRLQSGSAAILVGLSVSGVVALNGFLGQTGAFVGTLGVVAAGLWISQPLVAGLLLGMLSIKPQYALPLLLVAVIRRERAIVIGAAASFAALVLLSGLMFGFTQWAEFVAALRQPNPTLPFMVSWVGLADRLAPHVALAPILTFGVYASGIAALLGAFVRVGPTSVHPRAAAATTLAWALVLSPNTHPYDLLLLAPAIALLGERFDATAVGLCFLVVSWIAIVPNTRWLLSAGLLASALTMTWLALTIRNGVGGTADGTKSAS